MFQLIRYKNILFTILIQWLIYNAIIVPTLQMYTLSPLLQPMILWLMILATALITAGGYVINDYFDIKIDRINRPDRVIIGTQVSKQAAMGFYQVLTALGIIAGVVVAFALKSFTIGFIYIVVPGMLWFYSASYKRQLIIGNAIVAVSAGLVVLLPLIAESELLVQFYGGDLIRQTPVLHTLYIWICSFACFAVLFTFIREIIKDIEDQEGDREMECHTIPIVWGECNAKIIITVLSILTTGLLGWLVFTKIHLPDDTSLTIRYWLFGIVLPVVCMLFILWRGKASAYRNAGNICKFIMLIGILYSLIYYFLIAKAYNLVLFGLFNIAQ